MRGDVARHGQLRALPGDTRCTVILIARDDGLKHVARIHDIACQDVRREVGHIRAAAPACKNPVRHEEHVVHLPRRKPGAVSRFIVADDLQVDVDIRITVVERIEQHVQNRAFDRFAVRIPMRHRDGDGLPGIFVHIPEFVIFVLNAFDLILGNVNVVVAGVKVSRTARGKHAEGQNKPHSSCQKHSQFFACFHQKASL